MTSRNISRRHAVAHLARAAALVCSTLAVSPALYAADAMPEPPRANPVLYWNDVASEAFSASQGTNPMAQSRSFAILQTSVHDALNAIDRRYVAYTAGLPAARHASPDAAVAAAARAVLVRLLPEQQAQVEQAYGRALAALPDGDAKSAGIATGQAAAWATLERRANDGASRAAVPYLPLPGPGEYQFTPPFDFAALPGWGQVQPWVITVAEHALQGPQPLTSAAYAHDLNTVKALGHVASKTRTADQTEIASFWYEDSPLGWNRIANGVARQRGLDAWEAARAFALLHLAMADGFIAGFEQKYAHRFWRPETAIRAADTDGNPLTAPDAQWKPLLVTPPVPDYPSTHTVLGWAAAEVLADVFGDRQRFSATSLTLPGVSRQYRSFSQAAEENGMSRLYAGIHFQHAVRDGRRQGRSIGKAVSAALPRAQ